jgi:O-acetyl-ADP-ribose deacetylase (regulator of RNase III)
VDQNQRRNYLLERLLSEDNFNQRIPQNEESKKQLLRGLMNIRMPAPIDDEFLKVQDEYLKGETAAKGVVDIATLKPACGNLYIWRGDITRLKCGAIVNAANSGMTGCYQPCHNCIDNCIHTYAGIQLRNYCYDIMQRQGHEEKTGGAKITPAFNLPCDYVIHTVGPIVMGKLSDEHRRQLASCYLSCLKLAEENGVKSIAFCCISTGVFMFPNEEAARIAVNTVKNYLEQTHSNMEVIFNVFKENDESIYSRLLS